MVFSSCLLYAPFDVTSTYGYKNIALLLRFFFIIQRRLSSSVEEQHACWSSVSAHDIVFASSSARPSVWYWTGLSSKVNRYEFTCSPRRISTVLLKMVSKERTGIGLRFLCNLCCVFQSLPK